MTDRDRKRELPRERDIVIERGGKGYSYREIEEEKANERDSEIERERE